MAEGDSELQDLYRDVLLDYYRSRAHKGRLEPADIDCAGKNPLCGDEVLLTMRLKDGVLSEVRHDGHGCVISQASTAMLAEAVEGASPDRARELAEFFKSMMLGKRSFDDCPEDLDELKSLAGVAKFPVRIKCAILAWNTLLEGLKARSHGDAKAAFVEK